MSGKKITLMMDGNFKAQHLNMRREKDDIALADGHAFFVEDKAYKIQLTKAVDTPQVRTMQPSTTVSLMNFPAKRSTCNDHKAVSQANAERHNLEATGIGAVACSRHGAFVPHTVVDFQKGEK